MSAGAEKGSKVAKTTGKRAPRAGNVHERIAAARERRETATQPSKPKQDPKSETAKPLPPPDTLSRLTQPKDAANTSPDRKATPNADPEDAQSTESEETPTTVPEEPSQRRAGLLLWSTSAVIAAGLVSYVGYSSRPGASHTGDVQSDTRGAGYWTPPLAKPAPTEHVNPARPARLTAVKMPTTAPEVAQTPKADAPPTSRADGTAMTGSVFDPSDYRIVLNAPTSVSPPQLESIVTQIKGAGFAAEPRQINLSISESNVRFYHAQDAEMAAFIAEAAGAEARDFTDFRPAPPAGLIEIWLAGRPVGGSSTTQGSQPRSEFARDLRDLGNSIKRALGQR